jgi:hypothetical protein
MNKNIGTLTVKIDIQLSLWSAIKLRIAGKKFYKLAIKIIKDMKNG